MIDEHKLIDDLTKAVVNQKTLALSKPIKISGDGPIYDVYLRIYDSPVRQEPKVNPVIKKLLDDFTEYKPLYPKKKKKKRGKK